MHKFIVGTHNKHFFIHLMLYSDQSVEQQLCSGEIMTSELGLRDLIIY